MKYNAVKVLMILLIAELMLVGYAFLGSRNYFPFLSENIRFMSPEKLADFKMADDNDVADSLLQRYLLDTASGDVITRTQLSAIGPKKKNLFLINPVVDGHTALDNFFKAMMEEKDSTVVRIAHYGDSQLEGDRMTCLIRDKFHQKFGGSGIGYVPCKDLEPISYTRRSSGNWSRYTVFHDKYSNNYYGLSGMVFRFGNKAVYQSDDTTAAAKEGDPKFTGGSFYSGSVSVKMSPKYTYNSISVMYGRTHDYTVMNYYDAGTGDRFASDTLAPSDIATLHKHKFSSPVLNVKIEFIADNAPDFYGLYFDANTGLQTDNYAIRGHSGDGLMLINDDHLARMIKELNTRLVIFQYGANVVPYIHSDEACTWLSGVYYDLFMKFRKASPGLSIIVIGAGDMAHGGEGGSSSYTWLPKITEAQKAAALKAGCAYWDLFGMMGGLNSIMVWSNKKLAVPNGHFSAKGQEIIANELVDALLVEYNVYLHKTRNKK